MRKTIMLSGIGVALGLLSTTAAAQGYGDGDRGAVLRCESSDGRFRQCTADTRGGVDLARQLSSTPCIRGRTWGDDARGIWVNDGCRAEFRIGDRGGYDGGYGGYGGGWQGGSQVFGCESDRGRGRQCAIDAPGRVQLVRQLSRAACVEGRSWGQNGRGVWVEDGCRAEFRVLPDRRGDWSRWRGRESGYSGGGHGGPGYGQSVRCESSDGRSRRCGAEIRRGAQLQRQLSASPCIEGRNWGWDREGIWVDDGCRAEFAVW